MKLMLKGKSNIEYSWTDSDGIKYWCKGDKENYHRLGAPAIEHPDGTKEYWVDGFRHREDGPAYEALGGHNEWIVNGRVHREDGPAITTADGTEYWYIDDMLLDCSTQEEFIQLMKLKAFW